MRSCACAVAVCAELRAMLHPEEAVSFVRWLPLQPHAMHEDLVSFDGLLQLKELQLYLSPVPHYCCSLLQGCRTQGKDLVSFERFLQLKKSGGNHCHYNAIAVPPSKGHQAEAVFQQAALRAGMTLQRVPGPCRVRELCQWHRLCIVWHLVLAGLHAPWHPAPDKDKSCPMGAETVVLCLCVAASSQTACIHTPDGVSSEPAHKLSQRITCCRGRRHDTTSKRLYATRSTSWPLSRLVPG